MPATAPPRPPASTPDASDEWANRCERIRSFVREPETPPLWLLVAAEIATRRLRLPEDRDPFNVNRTQYGGTAMVRAHLYRLVLPEINSFHKLAVQFQAKPILADWFGFDDSPNHDTLRVAWQERLNEQGRHVLEEYAAAIRRDMADTHHPAATRLLQEGDQPRKLERPKGATQAQKENALDWLRDHVFGDLADFGRADNAKYEDRLFLDILGWLSANQEFAEKGVGMFADTLNDGEACHPETLRYVLRNQDLDDVKERMNRAIDVVIDAATERGMLDRPAMLAIDSTEIPFYRSGNTPPPDEVKGVKGKPHSHIYEFMTISAEVAGRSVVLGFEPVQKGDDNARIAMKLIERARELVPVKAVLWDRWFHNIQLIRYCKENGIPYLGRAKKTSRVERLVEEKFERGKVAQKVTYTMQHESKREYDTTLIAVPHDEFYNMVDKEPEEEQVELGAFAFKESKDGDLGAFGTGTTGEADDPRAPENIRWLFLTTNIDMEIGEVDAWAEQYRRRWAIETQYRLIKHDFLAKTSSTDYTIRNYYFGFALLMYNCWRLYNVIVDLFWDGELLELERPRVPAALFGLAFPSREYG